ncbi:MAG: hypothetical protein PHE51_02235 [Eubacteriales bacterium]|nr:hypothetical protein [Eubacteriales bacterium]
MKIFNKENSEPQINKPRIRRKVRISLKNLIISAVVFGLVLSVVILGGVGIMYAAPGSEGDPVITKSYVEDVLMPNIHEYIKDFLTSNGQNNSFSVITVYAGETFQGGEGTEFILRQGSGTIIGSANGGVADLTRGYDLSSGESVPSNCLLVVPKAEGRGFKAATDVIIMVKGTYEIVK